MQTQIRRCRTDQGFTACLQNKIILNELRYTKNPKFGNGPGWIRMGTSSWLQWSYQTSLHFGRYEVVDENNEISDESTYVTAIVTFAYSSLQDRSNDYCFYGKQDTMPRPYRKHHNR